MITECAAIIAIILCMVFIFMRSGHGDYAFSVLPLVIVPAVHIVAPFFANISTSIGLSKYAPMAISVIDICALALTCIFVLVASNKIKSNRNKKLYIALMCGYSAILTCVFVTRTISPILTAL